MTYADELEVRDLLARYLWSYNFKDEGAWIDTFSQDGVLTDNTNFRAEGHQELRETFRFFLTLHESEDWQHHETQHLFTAVGNQCEVLSYWYSLHGTAVSGYRPHGQGTYRTRCIRADEGWRIAERCFVGAGTLAPSVPG